jgi:hypothetical protein
LVPADSVDAWQRAFLRILDEPKLLARLHAGVPAPRRMDAVASEMQTIYRALVERDPGGVVSLAAARALDVSGNHRESA